MMLAIGRTQVVSKYREMKTFRDSPTRKYLNLHLSGDEVVNEISDNGDPD